MQWVVHGCIPLQVRADCAFVKTDFQFLLLCAFRLVFCLSDAC